jgi:hypothetical protein
MGATVPHQLQLEHPAAFTKPEYAGSRLHTIVEIAGGMVSTNAKDVTRTLPSHLLNLLKRSTYHRYGRLSARAMSCREHKRGLSYRKVVIRSQGHLRMSHALISLCVDVTDILTADG